MVGHLEPLLAWLRTGTAAGGRLDFPTGTALPDGRLDLCKQALGPDGAAQVAEAMRPGVVRHLLLGTDGLGDGAAEAVGQAVEREVETLYLGCNGITSGGACRIADNLRMSPQASKVTGIWLKRNPIGDGDAAAAIVEAAQSLRTLDLVQTSLDATGLSRVVAAMLTATAAGRRIDRLYVGGNPLGPAGATHLAALLAADAVSELYVSAAQLGDEGAHIIADALKAGSLRRISLASNGIGPQAAAGLVIAAVRAGVEVCDLGRVKAAGVLGAQDNRLNEAAATAIADELAQQPHRLQHLVLSNTGLHSQAAHRLLDGAQRAVTPTRFILGKGVATSIRRRLDALSAAIPERPAVPADVAAVRSVHRQPPPA
ncbi:Ran GTPase-activating protein (RanGAP) involved in mRNA processing and transport [Kibdelosporangium banguiense]|uniref:Ran GTPase-activating protein (RanGAP) involved in mRNA processing and transport n=1 Tax=Kibdelosporangium banguiense TaxID=1365924 RepID=A0ABS4TT06_9PSEU|nr:ribonuclease inhibitor [Kibdelosporangium banguiense]MBP2327068.1 Ran GTPase-activating protein (RanGAP) involved in mRNA processing and transport [Kibdelosporangium banguiense]